MYESALFAFFGFSGFRCSALVSSRFLSSSGSRYLRLHTATAPLCTTVFLHFEHAKKYARNSPLLHSLHGAPWLIFTLVAFIKIPRAYVTNTRFPRLRSTSPAPLCFCTCLSHCTLLAYFFPHSRTSPEVDFFVDSVGARVFSLFFGLGAGCKKFHRSLLNSEIFYKEP